ncbi:MAG: DUF1697 domain-containing protein [Candidatus Synoicihabitans palmerolidicus]|nr:DUF1697 domain-containing protein [Candidatus Synoicihabitans palmerolidicus]
MPHYFAFLRGINLGKRRIKMDQLQAIIAELPVTNVKTYIASGNVMFTSPSRHAVKLATTLSAHLTARPSRLSSAPVLNSPLWSPAPPAATFGPIPPM